VDKTLSPKSTPFCFKRGWIVSFQKSKVLISTRLIWG